MELVHRHHVLFPRKVHEAHPGTKELREKGGLIIPMHDLGHSALHKTVTLVPPLDRYTVNRVLNEFDPVNGDYLRNIEKLIRAIEKATLSPRSSRIERMNGDLTAFCIEEQIPFIRAHMADRSNLRVVRRRAA